MKALKYINKQTYFLKSDTPSLNSFKKVKVQL